MEGEYGGPFTPRKSSRNLKDKTVYTKPRMIISPSGRKVSNDRRVESSEKESESESETEDEEQEDDEMMVDSE